MVIVVVGSTMVSASVTRTITGNQLVYSTDMSPNYAKGYWTINDVISKVTDDCYITSHIYVEQPNLECATVSNQFQCVAYTTESGGNMPTQIIFNLDGTGTCQLSGQYVESYTGNMMTQPVSMGSSNVVFSLPEIYCAGPVGANCESEQTQSECEARELCIWGDGPGQCDGPIGFGCETYLTQSDCELPQHEGCYWDDGSTVQCNTDADTNCDGCVSDLEFPGAVNNWKQQLGEISDLEFPGVVNNWKQQNGC